MIHLLLFLLVDVGIVKGGSLSDIKHVVLFMQENRAFDHYFGTMAGVRGFADPNVPVNPDGRNTFEQIVNAHLSTQTNTLLPWYAGYQGGNSTQAIQCMVGGSNAWSGLHAAYDNGLNDHWVINNSPYSMAYYKRGDIPVHFGIAEAFTVADMYQQSVMSATDPNRLYWFSGSTGIPGGPQTPDEGGPVLQNAGNAQGCQHKNPNLNCFPLMWPTMMEHLQNAGVTWQIFQNPTDDYADILTDFAVFRNAKPGSPLYDRGMLRNTNTSLDTFYKLAQEGNLPQVSWIIGDQELCEHPPWRPQDGGWLQKQIVEAIISGQSYKDTVLMISYDEGGGWADHVTPFHSPNGTGGEWIQDPWGQLSYTITGPGHRLPFYVISPWTRGGNVFTEHADHSSQVMFLEQWLQASGYNVHTNEINAWRRQYMSNLVLAFDFNNPDFSIPTIPDAPMPPQDSEGNWIGREQCEKEYPEAKKPPIPYGKQSASTSLATEQGFKQVRGQLTEGRYLTFEMNGYALTNPAKGDLTTTTSTANHETLNQRWILHQSGSQANKFDVPSVVNGKYIAGLAIDCLPDGTGYSLSLNDGYLSIDSSGGIAKSSQPAGFQIFSVSYST